MKPPAYRVEPGSSWCTPVSVVEIMEGRTLPKRIVSPESVYTQVMAEREVANRKY